MGVILYFGTHMAWTQEDEEVYNKSVLKWNYGYISKTIGRYTARQNNAAFFTQL